MRCKLAPSYVCIQACLLLKKKQLVLSDAKLMLWGIAEGRSRKARVAMNTIVERYSML